MNRRLMILFCLVGAVLLLGGQVFAQTHLTFKGTNYASTALKAMPVDKDHMVLIGEQLGLEVNNQPAFNNMSTHFSLIVYFNKDTGWHFQRYCQILWMKKSERSVAHPFQGGC
jgi:hypothetical protein